jgi:hypothetical protein
VSSKTRITTEKLSDISPLDSSTRFLYDAMMNFKKARELDPEGERELFVPFSDQNGLILGRIVDVEIIPFSESEDGIVEFHWDSAE